MRELTQSIGRAAERFLDPEDPVRLEALEWLVPTAGISAEMAAMVLTGMARDWTGDRLAELLERELGAPEVLDDFQRLDSGRTVHATGPALSFHVGAGTVPGVSVSSMIRALLVKSAVLLKPGKGDVAPPGSLRSGYGGGGPGAGSRSGRGVLAGRGQPGRGAGARECRGGRGLREQRVGGGAEGSHAGHVPASCRTTTA